MKVLVNPSPSQRVKIQSLGISIRPREEYEIPTAEEASFGANAEIVGYIQNRTLQASDGTTTYTDPKQGEVFMRNQFGAQAVSASASGAVNVYDNIILVDQPTGVTMTTFFYNQMSMARELYNDPSNPLYKAGFAPLLGDTGTVTQLNLRVLNVETNSNNQSQRLTALESEAGADAQRLTVLETDANQLFGRVSTLEGDATDLFTRVAGLETGRTADETAISNLQAQLASLSSGGTTGGTTTGGTTTGDPDLTNRVANLENIHGKNGWHEIEVRQANYRRPDDLLVYYGWLSSFNSATNGWDNNKVAHELARYGMVVLGGGLADPSHGDHANVMVIVPRAMALNPYLKVFGYVTAHQDLTAFEAQVDQWEAVGVHGIFMDECGYDYGVNRDDFNARVDYVHGRAHANLCFVNAWNMDHIIGVADDGAFPNATFNPSGAASHVTASDWYLLESFAINTAAYSGSAGVASQWDWAARGVKAVAHRYNYGINVASVGVIDDGNAAGQDLFGFNYVAALMFALDATGTSDTYYGGGSAASKFWPRPDLSGMSRLYSISPSVQQDAGSWQLYHRYVGFGHFSLDFGARTAAITKY